MKTRGILAWRRASWRAQGDFAEQDVTILLELSRTDNTTPVEKGK
jgi:hypothetical protein